MKNKPYKIIGRKIYPQKTNKPSESSQEIIGSNWRIWREESKCFLEYDEGHFATKMITIEIREDDFDRIAARPDVVNEIINAKQKEE